MIEIIFQHLKQFQFRKILSNKFVEVFLFELILLEIFLGKQIPIKYSIIHIQIVSIDFSFSFFLLFEKK